MLMPIYDGQRRSPGEKPARELDHSYLYRSTDNGQTWAYFAEIGDGKPQLNETALLHLSSGKFLAAMRSGAGDVWLSESDDGARTWSRPKLLTPPSIHPADLVELDGGRALTLYYATQVKEHPEWRVHCGAVVYDLPPGR